jgi:hypothetical protein
LARVVFLLTTAGAIALWGRRVPILIRVIACCVLTFSGLLTLTDTSTATGGRFNTVSVDCGSVLDPQNRARADCRHAFNENVVAAITLLGAGMLWGRRIYLSARTTDHVTARTEATAPTLPRDREAVQSGESGGNPNAKQPGRDPG